jgi:hypothetical protein
MLDSAVTMAHEVERAATNKCSFRANRLEDE